MGDTRTGIRDISSGDEFDIDCYQQAIVVAELETIGKFDISPPFEIGSEAHDFFRDITRWVYRKLCQEKLDAD